ncbi:radical SAM protein [Acuticoccus sp. M5D2P5]|uniref:radical SAM protein n=1 Tax=Acuticoccus kalidii TaxID=2910977 RepID=UPI001F1EA3A9|nr:radical SAM protein [Acuticoccus kalidii]MCF3933033.1 radical SAM protein [Acuticoccus kalidii]
MANSPDAKPFVFPAEYDYRAAMGSVIRHLKENPELKPAFEKAKAVPRTFANSAFYEVTQRCNLFCEGCYYFEGDKPRDLPEESDVSRWEDFFRAERDRGVTMGYFLGAEPSMEPKRLVAGAKYIPHGNVGTNGTKKIPEEVPFRIQISIWGDEATDKKLRGGAVFRKAIKNYAGDPRALALFTFNPYNVKHARQITEMCADAGLPITFNIFSPTTTYLDKLRQFMPNDKKFFRISDSESNMLMSTDDLMNIRDTASELLNDFPDTVIYCEAYNRLSTSGRRMFELDPETGLAEGCRNRLKGTETGFSGYYSPDLKKQNVKCCTPDVDCSECRIYGAGWSSLLAPPADLVQTVEGLKDWIDAMNTLARIFIYDHQDAEMAGAYASRLEHVHA